MTSAALQTLGRPHGNVRAKADAEQDTAGRREVGAGANRKLHSQADRIDERAEVHAASLQSGSLSFDGMGWAEDTGEQSPARGAVLASAPVFMLLPLRGSRLSKGLRCVQGPAGAARAVSSLE